MKKVMVGIIISIFLVSCSNPLFQGSNKKEDLSKLTPEEVLDKYFYYLNYDNVNDSLNKMLQRKTLASGVLLKHYNSGETYEEFLVKFDAHNQELLNYCAQSNKRLLDLKKEVDIELGCLILLRTAQYAFK